MTPDALVQELYGGVPFVAVKVNEYGMNSVPLGRGLVEVIEGRCAACAIIAMPDMTNNMNNEIIFFLKRCKCIFSLTTDRC
jgi:hypothetical protein